MRFHFPLALCLLANLVSGPSLLASDEPLAERKRLIQRVQEQLEVAVADAKHFRELEAPKWAEEAEERAAQLKKRLKELSQDQSEEKEKPSKDDASRKDPPREKVRLKEEAARPAKDASNDEAAQWLASTKTMLARLRRQSERLRDEGQPQEGLRMAERVAQSMALTSQVAALTEKINQLAKDNRPDQAQAIRKEREVLMREVRELLTSITQPKTEKPNYEARRQELEQLERKLMEVRRNGPPEAIRDIEVAMQKLRHGQREQQAAPEEGRRRKLTEELEALRNKLRQPPSNDEEMRRYQAAEARIAELENLLRQLEHGPGHVEKNPRHSMIMERIEHLRAAANHLKQADAHDIAQELMRQSEQMQRELEAARKHGPEGHAHPGPLGELHQQLQQMREENEILKREIRELRQPRK